MEYQRRKSFEKKLFLRQSYLAIVAASLPNKLKNTYRRFSIIALILVTIFPFIHVRTSNAQGSPLSIRQVRVRKANEIDLNNPVGLAFSDTSNAFYIVDASQSSPTDTVLVKVTQLSEQVDSVRMEAALQNPINITFDNKSNRLLFLNRQASELLELQTHDNETLNTASLIHYDIGNWGLKNPQGMTIDQSSGTLFILDAAEPRIVQVKPSTHGSFDDVSISAVSLQPSGLSSVSGIAFDPASGYLFVINPIEQTLYELNRSGKLSTTFDLAPFNLKNPQAIVFAPSGDQTDDPTKTNLYLADGGLGKAHNSMRPRTGQIVELSLSAAVEPSAAGFTSSLVNMTNIAAVSPPSPDPSGITYLPNTNKLLIVDGEVEETVDGITHFQGANVWELTLSGDKVRTANISKVSPTLTPMTNEPTDIVLNPSNGHYYVTDDDDGRVYDLNPGVDGFIGTSDDSWGSFSTNTAGSADPEGISFNTWNNHIFVADGANAEIYEFTITGTLIDHFDVLKYGVQDPESVVFNMQTGTLFIMSSDEATRVIIETTTDGALLQTIDVSATNARAAAGLAYAPASNGSGAKRFYIVDRGVDNNTYPNIIDGKMYEITAPASARTAIFTDVPLDYWAWSYVERIYEAGITSGCKSSPMMYCPSTTVTRDQMAVFLLKGKHGSSYVPPAATGMFADVPQDHWAAAWIEELAKEGITSGCSVTPQASWYCPGTEVTRDQMAVFLLKAKHGSGYMPPAATGDFADVPQSYWAAAWIEQLAAEGVTSGCATNPLKYCPSASVTRDQMAVFLVRNFNLP
jgi:uncharacterized protein YjiK